ncbi:MAG: hypothetical protein HRU37_14285 [Roseibacillus sp.]|nr:hypothetical protein [Roseibacillus sp.]
MTTWRKRLEAIREEFSHFVVPGREKGFIAIDGFIQQLDEKGKLDSWVDERGARR